MAKHERGACATYKSVDLPISGLSRRQRARTRKIGRGRKALRERLRRRRIRKSRKKFGWPQARWFFLARLAAPRLSCCCCRTVSPVGRMHRTTPTRYTQHSQLVLLVPLILLASLPPFLHPFTNNLLFRLHRHHLLIPTSCQSATCASSFPTRFYRAITSRNPARKKDSATSPISPSFRTLYKLTL